MEPFDPGSAVVVRNVIFGRPYSVWPHRVVADDGSQLSVLLRPGTMGMGPTLWIQALRENAPSARESFLTELAVRKCELGPWTWRRTTMLMVLYPGRYFSVSPTWEDGQALGWYVNFQVPYQRTRMGVDTCDLHIDLEVSADFTCRWKDEGEYTHARRLGLVSDQCHKRVVEAREAALAMVDDREGPFAHSWQDWRPDPSWSLPAMPVAAMTEPASPLLQGLPK